MDDYNRWSQIVRRPGAVEIQGHLPIQVPPLNQPFPSELGQPGVRLLTRPLVSPEGPYVIDVTSSAVNAMLEGFLKSGAHVGKRLSWSSRGFGIRRRDTVKIEPL